MSYGHLFKELDDDKLCTKAYRKIEPDFIEYITSTKSKYPTGFTNKEIEEEFISNIKLIFKSSILLNEKNLTLPKLDYNTMEWLVSVVSMKDEPLSNLFKKIYKF